MKNWVRDRDQGPKTGIGRPDDEQMIDSIKVQSAEPPVQNAARLSKSSLQGPESKVGVALSQSFQHLNGFNGQVSMVFRGGFLVQSDTLSNHFTVIVSQMTLYRQRVSYRRRLKDTASCTESAHVSTAANATLVNKL